MTVHGPPYLLPPIRIERLLRTILRARWDADSWRNVRQEVPSAQGAAESSEGWVVELSAR